MPTRPPRVFPFAEIPVDHVRSIHGCTRAQAQAILGRVRRQHADPAWMRAMLARLPATARALLAVLLDSGGGLTRPELFARVERRYGFGDTRAGLALGALVEHLLVIELVRVEGVCAACQEAGADLADDDRLDDAAAADDGGDDDVEIALISPTAHLVAAHLGRVLTAAEVAAALATADDSDDAEHGFAMAELVTRWARARALPATDAHVAHFAAGLGLLPEPARTEALQATSFDELQRRIHGALETARGRPLRPPRPPGLPS